MKFTKTLGELSVVFFFLALFYNCERRYFEFDKLKDVTYSPQLALPLVNSRLGMDDILARNQLDLIQTDAEGLITLVYEDNLIEVNPFQLLPPLEQKMEYSLGTGIPGTLTFNVPGSLNYADQVDIDYPAPQDQKLREIKLKSGKLLIELNPSFPGITPDIDLDFTLPGIILADGSTYSVSKSIPSNSPNTFTVDLTGATVDFTKGALADDRFALDYDATINYNAGDQLGKNDKLDYGFTLQDVEIKHVIGDFGSQQIPIAKDSLKISIFGQVSSKGKVRLTNPKLFFEINNGIGLPFRVLFNELYSYNEVVDQTYPILFQTFPNPFPINSPVKIDDTVATSLEVNKDNTSIIEILSPTPKYLIYDVVGEVNPGGGPNYNFISDESIFKIKARAELPLEGFVDTLKIQDTVEFSLGQTVEELESATVNIITTNGLPLDAKLQIYLYDSKANNNAGQVLDSLITLDNNQIFVSGVPGANGKIDQTTLEDQTIQVVLNQQTAQSMVTSDKMIISAQLETYNAPNQSIKLFNDYGLGIKIGVNLKGAITVGSSDI